MPVRFWEFAGSTGLVVPASPAFYTPAIQPSGGTWTALNTRQWNTRALSEGDSANAEGWDSTQEGQQRALSNCLIISDPTAPTSPNNVHRTKYVVGLLEGESPNFPGMAYVAGFSTARRAIYIRSVIKLSSNFRLHPSGVTKVTHVRIGTSPGSGSNDFFFRFGGAEAADAQFAVNTQNRFGGARTWTRNMGSAGDDIVPRSQWAMTEVVIGLESAVGVSDGYVRAAVNGRQIINVTGERFLFAGEEAFRFTSIYHDRTWGGNGAGEPNVLEEFYYDEDHTVIMAAA